MPSWTRSLGWRTTCSPTSRPPRTSASKVPRWPTSHGAEARAAALDDEDAPARRRGGRARCPGPAPRPAPPRRRCAPRRGSRRRGAPGRVDEVADHVHALLLDAERRDLGEARGLDAAHARAERPLAAPVLDHHLARRAGPARRRSTARRRRSRGRSGRRARRAACRRARCARSPRGRAARGPPPARARRGTASRRSRAAAPRRVRRQAGRHQRRARGLDLVVGGVGGEARRLELLLRARVRRRRACSRASVETGARLAQPLGALRVAPRLRERGLGERDARVGGALLRLGGLEARPRAGLVARVEGRGLDARDHRRRPRPRRPRRGRCAAGARRSAPPPRSAARTRVSPSSSTVTRSGPRVTSATSTGTAAARISQKATQQGAERGGATARRRRLQRGHGYSRVFSTATRSSRSRRRRTSAAEASAASERSPPPRRRRSAGSSDERHAEELPLVGAREHRAEPVPDPEAEREREQR